MNQVNIDKIIAYENGELDEEETIALFQQLVNTGMAWSLQGHYGRTAMAMIEAGLIRTDDHDEEEFDFDDDWHQTVFGTDRTYDDPPIFE